MMTLAAPTCNIWTRPLKGNTKDYEYQIFKRENKGGPW